MHRYTLIQLLGAGGAMILLVVFLLMAMEGAKQEGDRFLTIVFFILALLMYFPFSWIVAELKLRFSKRRKS